MRKKDIEKELSNISPEKIFKYLSEKSFGPKRYTHKNGIRIDLCKGTVWHENRDNLLSTRF